MTIPAAVLDSDVIFSRVLHELMGRLALTRFYRLIWSDELLAEAKRVLIRDKPLGDDVAERWVGYLSGSFPDGRIDISSVASNLALCRFTSDPDDEHVCALALAGEASFLFTFDRGYLREPLSSHGVDVLEPDVFLSGLIDQESLAVIDVLEEQRAAWQGGRPILELLDAFERARCPVFASKARQILSS